MSMKCVSILNKIGYFDLAKSNHTETWKKYFFFHYNLSFEDTYNVVSFQSQMLFKIVLILQKILTK